jgi:DNA repair protein RadC
LVTHRLCTTDERIVHNAHNHPSGVAEPSQADREVTAELLRALRLVDVRVLDHLVVGSGGIASLAQMGWL